MTTKSLLMTGALALASLTVASAKSYDITLSAPAQAGSVQLKPGEYRVKIQGSNAIFTNVESAKSFTAPVKVDKTGKKHEQTAVQSQNQNGTEKIQAIELGGSDETLEFGE